jgi:zinc protease
MIARCRLAANALVGIISVALAFFLALPGARAEDSAGKQKSDPAFQAAQKLYEGIRTETLPNGLAIYLKPIANSPVVTTMVAYKVGSADEDLDHTGLSHYLEHLMFKGTDKIMPGDIDRMTLRGGGMNNAFTAEDYTVYYFALPADDWQFALQIEADRMRNLRIDARHEFEQEKGAVISELERNEDYPWDLELKTILPLLFDKGPYGHPVIGERDQVRGATAQVIKSYYDKWYYPNNASLVVCGGFDPDETLAQIRKLFGPLPQGTLPERKPVPPAPERRAAVHKEIPSKFENARMLMGFNTVPIGSPDYYVLEVIQDLLTRGKTGRLYRKLVEDLHLAQSVDSSNSALRYPGWFAIQVELLKGSDRGKAEELVLDELKSLQEKPVDAPELARVKRGLLASTVFGRESVRELAEGIARAVSSNDLDFLKGYLPRVAAVSAQDIERVARKYFDPNQRVVVWSVPGHAAGAGAGGGVGSPGLGLSRAPQRLACDTGHEMLDARHTQANIQYPTRNAQYPAKGGAADTGSKGFTLESTKRVELPNGLTLLLFENHALPIVVADAEVRWVPLLEPDDKAGVAMLTGMLLDEGTAHHTGRQIADLIGNSGGSLGMNRSGGTVHVLSPDRHLGLSLLFECLAEPNFPEEAFARKKAQLLSAIADDERQPDYKAQTLYRSLVYGKHPFGRPTMGRLETVQALTREDCDRFHRQAFAPGNTIVAVVGDFDSGQVIEEVKQLTAGWKNAPPERPRTPAVEPPGQFVERIVSMPDAAQLHFFMGHPGIRRDNPDYYKLLVMDYVLGTGPGFTDRLSARLRDREGLGYTVNANITTTASNEPGLFTCYIGTRPEVLGRVKKEFLEEIQRLHKEKPGAEEVEDARKYLIGSLAFQFTTDAGIASKLLDIERYHLGFNYVEDYRKAVAAVTPAEVQEVAQKYLHPDHMVLVAAGAVGPDGKPIQKLKPPRPAP